MAGPERQTFINALQLTSTSQWAAVKLEAGEFVLQAGVRARGVIEGGDADTPGTAVPCDMHELNFTLKRLAFKRAPAGNVKG